MTIGMVISNSVELLNRGFELDLYGLHEFNMIFSYLRYLYQLFAMNRKTIILGMAGEEIAKRGMINFDDLNNSHEVFKAKRAKFSPL
jgi:hypothetical protein